MPTVQPSTIVLNGSKIIMQIADILSNPFAMLVNPAEVLQLIGRSERLGGLTRHVCRPLDKANNVRMAYHFNDFDAAVDSEPETD
jgi:hypothetical protein